MNNKQAKKLRKFVFTTPEKKERKYQDVKVKTLYGKMLMPKVNEKKEPILDEKGLPISVLVDVAVDRYTRFSDEHRREYQQLKKTYYTLTSKEKSKIRPRG